MKAIENSVLGASVVVGCLMSVGCAPTQSAAVPHLGVQDYERVACAEVPDADRDQGPFARHDRIERVEELREKEYPKAPPQPVGIAVYIRATSGVTQQSVGRVIACHLAHRAVVGDGVPDRDSPLFVDDARISVSSTPTAFRVAITSPHIDVARAVIEKGSVLTVE
jgi:hypothetical protein